MLITERKESILTNIKRNKNNNLKMECVGKFIPNTNKRYTITQEGLIYSNYRYNKNGKKIFNRKEVRRYLNSPKGKTLVVDLQFGKHSLTNRMKTVYLNTLMEKCFSLTPPDKFHFYDLRFKDGDCFNSALSNLEYRIRTNVSSNHKHYPQPFYNFAGKITHKVCGECGSKKEIKHFHLQNPREERQNRTYRNVCEPCRAKIQWNAIKSDEKRLAKFNERKHKWQNSIAGKKYNQEYRKEAHQFHFKNITPHYIASSLKLYKDNISEKELTPELIKLVRKKILLRRTIKQINK